MRRSLIKKPMRRKKVMRLQLQRKLRQLRQPKAVEAHLLTVHLHPVILHTVILIIQAAAIPVHQVAQITTMHMRTTMMIVIHPVRTMAVHHQAAVPVLNHQAVHPDQKVGITLGQLAA